MWLAWYKGAGLDFIGLSPDLVPEHNRPEARVVAIADPLSPGHWRVNCVVQKSAAFQEAFGCKAGRPTVRKPLAESGECCRSVMSAGDGRCPAELSCAAMRIAPQRSSQLSHASCA